MAFVQQTETSSAGSPGSLTTGAITTTAGNLLWIVVTYDDTASPTVSSSQSDVITAAPLAISHSPGIHAYFAGYYAVAVGGSTTFTLGNLSTTTGMGIYVAEYHVPGASFALSGTGAASATQVPSAIGADLLIAGPVGSSGSVLLLGFSIDSQFNGSVAPTAGTTPVAFTGRTPVWATRNLGTTSALPEDATITGNGTATAGTVSGNQFNNFNTIAAAFSLAANPGGSYVDDPNLFDEELEDELIILDDAIFENYLGPADAADFTEELWDDDTPVQDDGFNMRASNAAPPLAGLTPDDPWDYVEELWVDHFVETDDGFNVRYISTTPLIMPNLVGLTVTAAIAILNADGFLNIATGIALTTTVAPGIVASQTPAAGTAVLVSTPIMLFAPGLMPNLVGLPLQEALWVLQQTGFLVPAAIGYFGTYPVTVVWKAADTNHGIVTAQSLPAGLPAGINQPITLTVNDYPTGVAFPAGGGSIA